MPGRDSILIVGVGSIGERHLRCFQAMGRVEVAICEINPALRREIAGRYNVARVYSTLEEALSDRPSAAVICTPAHLHLPNALAAAEAGAHLLIEKPLGTAIDGLEPLRTTIARRQLTAAVAYVYRAHPALAAMRQAIVTGRFGQPVQVVGTFGQHFPFYRPAYRETYYRDRATGGGAIQDALTHVINAAEWLVGPVDRVAADAAHQVLPGVDVEDTVHVLTRHGTVPGCFALNQHQAPNEATLTVVCSAGTARFEYHACRWRWQTDPGGAWNDEPVAALDRDTLFVRQAEAFLDAVAGVRLPLCSMDEGVQTLRANLAIIRAVDQQTWVAV